jgi:parallel beta-helix repeat protein
VPQPWDFFTWLSVARQASRAAGQATPPAVSVPSVEVHPGQSIQAAVDAAGPGTVVFLDPGIYHQTVTVSKPDVFLVGLGGPGAVVLDNPGGADDGISVTRQGAGFGLFDVTVRGFGDNGVFLDGVSRFLLDGVTATDNGEYGIFPSGGFNGLITGCSGSGSSDTGIYVGQSLDVAVVGNTASGNVNGIEVENAVNVLVAGNTSSGNTVGILVDLLPGLDVKVAGNVLVAGNVVTDNTHPNFAPPSDIAALPPPGVGIFVLGGVGTCVEDNLVLGNPVIGVGVASSDLLVLGGTPVFDIQPDPVHTVVRDNLIFGAPLGADLFWDGSGQNNVWSGNTFGTSLSPAPLPSS